MTKAGIVVGVVALAVAGAATTWWLVTPRDGTHARATVPIATAGVVRTTLTTTTQFSGTLGYSGSYTLTPQLPGTITALPAAGTVISRGQHVYEVDGVGVFLFYGARPAWRPFANGMTAGPDVRELEQNLTALGFGGLSVDNTFSWATEQAIRDWQFATGQPVTGTVALGRIAFEPSALRIVNDSAAPGAPAQPGEPVLTATSTEPTVTMSVPATQTYLVHRGDRVTVTVPSGATSPGRVVEISQVASTPSDNATNQPNGSNGPEIASIPALVKLDHPAVAAHLDQAPVTVNVVDRQAKHVLAVPITSLVALAGGGYAVWVHADGTRHLVAVSPGLFADTLVQVTAPGLHVGDRVEVPAQ